jgi:hypothetical protein
MYPDWLAPLPQFGKALPADDFDGTLPYCSPANHLRPTKARDDRYVAGTGVSEVADIRG